MDMNDAYRIMTNLQGLLLRDGTSSAIAGRVFWFWPRCDWISSRTGLDTSAAREVLRMEGMTRHL